MTTPSAAVRHAGGETLEGVVKLENKQVGLGKERAQMPCDAAGLHAGTATMKCVVEEQ